MTLASSESQSLQFSITIPTPQRIIRLSRNLIPSFLLPGDELARSEEVRPTAWLDGLRGWASLIVFFYHFTYGYHRDLVAAGYGNGNNRSLFQLPFIRLITAGPSMVCLFFAVSGYSLSWAPMKELHNGATSTCLSRLASSTFRRPIRIFVPPLISSMMVFVFVRLGFYTYGDLHNDGWARFGFQEVRPHIAESLWAQWANWYHSTARLIHVFRFDSYTDYPYDGHLWTIPIEFRCSIILFSVIALLSRARLFWRLILMVALWVYCIWEATWEPLLFTSGLILAQIALLRGHFAKDDNGAELPLVEYSEKQQSSERIKRIGVIVLFVFGLFMAGAPDWAQETTPGYATIHNYFTPIWWGGDRWRFMQIMGSLFLIFSVSESPNLQSFFDNTASRYLGRISFSLYLCHGPICHMIGYALIPKLWQYTNGPVQAPIERASWVVLTPPQHRDELKRTYEGGTSWGFEMGFLLGGCVVVPVTVWAADLFTRCIDEPVVRLARRAEMSVGTKRYAS